MGIHDIRLADLTGRARIRHAALHLFASEGYAQASLRSIALRAEVSLALIAHHFGSKHQLRDAVDAWVLAMFERAAANAAGAGKAADDAICGAFAAAVGDLVGARPEIRAYLRRSAVVDATPNGIALVGSLLAITRGVVQRSRSGGEGDLGWQSLQLLLLVLGPALLEPILQRCIPDLFAEPGAQVRRDLDLRWLQPDRVGAPPALLQSERPSWPLAHV